MKSENGKMSDQEKHELAVQHLIELTDRLYSENISKARLAAYKLSWMQEDGLDILKKALLGGYPKTTKQAAAYGLRKMKGRMRKMALEVLQQGLSHNNRTTKAICEKSLELMKGVSSKKDYSQRKTGKQRIQEIAKKNEYRRYAEKKPPTNK